MKIMGAKDYHALTLAAALILRHRKDSFSWRTGRRP